MYWDRFDICEAYYCLEYDFHISGWLRARPSNKRRREATSVQLMRIQFKAGFDLDFSRLTENGKAIYRAAAKRWGLPLVEDDE